MAKSYKPHKIKVCRTYGNLYKDIKKGYEFIIKLAIPSWKSPFTEHGKAKVQLSHILQTDFPTTP